MVVLSALILFFSLLLPASSFAAISNSDCFDCHEKLKGASHGKVACLKCHNDISGLPHQEKLKKPLCQGCHGKAVSTYRLSVHDKKGVSCESCHNPHFPAKEGKNCKTCHASPSHSTLPSAKKHLSDLRCISCHGNPKQGFMHAIVYPPKQAAVTREQLDPDGNDTIDKAEWDAFRLSLKKKGKEPARVERKFSFPGNPHAVGSRSVSCEGCHGEKNLFRGSIITVNTDPPFTSKVQTKIFVPLLPDIAEYNKTPHGRAGVQCSNCHTSATHTDDSVCVTCHQKVFNIYKETVHARKGATQCTDCHNPHSIKAYRQLGALERVSICSRCHVNYLKTHKWLPHTELHFKYLECSTCHSPQSVKSIVFYFAAKQADESIPLNHEDISQAFGKVTEITELVDINRDGSIVSDELSSFFLELAKRSPKDLGIGSSIVVTSVYHDYSSKRMKEKVCGSCHSEKAPFYGSMYLAIPEKSSRIYVPVKGTILSALPTSFFIDLVLLGETKITKEDWARLVAAKGAERKTVVRELGMKLIDVLALLLIGIVIFFIALHIIGRVIFRR